MRTIALRTAEGRFIAHEVRIVHSLAARWWALSGERSLPSRAGLLLSPARGIHTLGMRFAIDVVFLSRQMRVLGLVSRVPPWRVLLAPRGTGRVLELAAGQIAATALKTISGWNVALLMIWPARVISVKPMIAASDVPLMICTM